MRRERSFVETARDLNVHRNTVFYRIDKVKALCPPLDLDDPYEREHLLVSLRLFDN